MIIFLILGVILFLFFLIYSSHLEINIEKVKFNLNKKKNTDYLIYLKFKIFNKITWLKIKLDDDRVKKINKKILKRNISINKSEIFEYLKMFKFNLKRIDLKICIGFENAFTTSILFGIISSFVPTVIASKMETYSKENCKYQIIAKFNKTEIRLDLNCIIEMKIVHIINVICNIFKKGRKKYDERTSDRRSYVCHNE